MGASGGKIQKKRFGQYGQTPVLLCLAGVDEDRIHQRRDTPPIGFEAAFLQKTTTSEDG
jgi:hypothetical protein